MQEVVKNVLGSATKIVFILVAVALIVLTVMGKLGSQEFMMVAMMVFSSYYANNKTKASNEKKPDSEGEIKE